MFTVKPPGKKIKAILSRLGSDYSIRLVDTEQCIYRKLNDSYDIEVSGLNNQRKSIRATIFLWKLEHDQPAYTVESIQVSSFAELKSTLTAMACKYQNLPRA